MRLLIRLDNISITQYQCAYPATNVLVGAVADFVDIHMVAADNLPVADILLVADILPVADIRPVAHPVAHTFLAVHCPGCSNLDSTL